MSTLRSILGYSVAAFTVTFAAAAPFLFGSLERAVGASGLRIDPTYSGGEIARTIDRGAYRIEIGRPVPRRWPTQRVAPFVQMTWRPANLLPARVTEEIDIDADGAPDVRVSFDPANLDLDVKPLTPAYLPHHGAGADTFSALIAKVNDGIVVRAPMK
jgi:hypothetical protein